MDKQTVKLMRGIAPKIKDMLDKDNNIRLAHEVKPLVVSLWNNVKGGQDVVSRMLKDTKIDFQSLSPRCFLLIRLINQILKNY